MTAAGSGSLARSVGDALRARGLRVATAESCTGGLVLKLLTDHPGSSDYVVGGVVAYADEVKEGVLQIPAALIRRHGAVSEEAARAMARGVRTLLEADVGVAITGVAGPGGGSKEKPVGTVWFGVEGPGGAWVELRHFPGDRDAVRQGAAEHALSLVLANLRQGEPPSPPEGRQPTDSTPIRPDEKP